MEQLQFVLPESIEWSYDEEGDVLYCSFNKPEPAITEELGNGLLARFRENDGTLVGLTIIGVRDIQRLQVGKQIEGRALFLQHVDEAFQRVGL